MAGSVQAWIPSADRVETFHDVAGLHDAIATGTAEPRRDDGEPMRVQELEGSYLLDGVPLNVLIDGEWLEGQREYLEPFWRDGSLPKPDPELIGEPVPDEAGPAKYAPLIYGGLAVGALWLLFGRDGLVDDGEPD